jgi:gluconokinase
MAAQYLLAIDGGSSSVRAALYDTAGRRVDSTLSRLEIDLTVAPGGAVQIAAETMRRALEQAIDGALASPGVRGAEIVGVSLATFWHSLVVMDAAGEPLTALLTWADTRSEPDALRLRDLLDAAAVHQRTGCILHPSFLPAKIAWLQRVEPETLERAAALRSIAEYCTRHWLGVDATSISMASGSGLLNQNTLAWDSELLDTLGIDAALLGEIVPATELLPSVVPEYAARWPRLKGVPWRAPIGDGAASNVGVGCVGPGRIALMVGTSGAVRRCEPGDNAEPIPTGLFRYRLDRRHRVTGGSLSAGGNIYAWMRETLVLPPQEQVEQVLRERAPAEHGLVVLPLWSGERSLGWVGDATAMLTGMKLHTTPLDLYQAILEGITYQFANIYDALARGDETVVATGGALRASPAWCQLIADALGREIHTSTIEEASLTGVALVGLRDLGLLGDDDLVRPAMGPRYAPRMGYQERHREARWRQQLLYDREVGPQGANLLARQTR